MSSQRDRVSTQTQAPESGPLSVLGVDSSGRGVASLLMATKFKALFISKISTHMANL